MIFFSLFSSFQKTSRESLVPSCSTCNRQLRLGCSKCWTFLSKEEDFTYTPDLPATPSEQETAVDAKQFSVKIKTETDAGLEENWGETVPRTGDLRRAGGLLHIDDSNEALPLQFVSEVAEIRESKSNTRVSVAEEKVLQRLGNDNNQGELGQFENADIFIPKSSTREKVGEEKMFVCDTCGAVFKRSIALKNHSRIHSGERPYPCKDCSQAFRTKLSLDLHVKRIHKMERPHECQDCGKKFFLQTELDEHATTHTGEKKHICETCGKAFAHRKTLKVHMKRHTGDKPHVCSQCGASFLLAHRLKEHARKHTGERPYVCDQCGETYTSSTYLGHHKAWYCRQGKLLGTVKPKQPRVKKHVCERCGKTFTKCDALKRHMYTHTGNKPHVCSECGASFRDSTRLRYHCLRQHSTERPFVCELCGHSFALSRDLGMHTKSCSEPNQTDLPCFPCSQCGDVFSSGKKLRKHLEIHPEACQKPFVCGQCGSGYLTAYGLSQHTKTTCCNEERLPFGCSQCSKSYATQAALKRHRQTHQLDSRTDLGQPENLTIVTFDNKNSPPRIP